MKKQNAIITQTKGFTLIELLVVIAIIGVLAAVVLLAINPAELLRRSRDSTRLSDMSTIRKAVDAVIAQSTTAIVLPCTAECNSTMRDRTVTGAGWIGATAGTFNLSAYMATLPIDPINTAGQSMACNGGAGCTANRATADAFYYFISNAAGEYEVNTRLESTQNITRLNSDGGGGGADNINVFETGTNLTLR